jgi:hypothetical protein
MLRTVAEAEPIDLITRQQYQHFELTLEWRVARGGNSGLLYRVTEALPHAWQSGLEMQLLDDAHHLDGQTPETSAGALYGLITPRRRGQDRSGGVREAGQHKPRTDALPARRP